MATSEDTRLSTAVFRTFEQLRHIDDQGRDYWSGREFAQALGYESFDRFRPVLRKARISCKRSDTLIRNHFGGRECQGLQIWIFAFRGTRVISCCNVPIQPIPK